MSRYNVPPSYKANMEDRNDTVKKIRLRVISVLKKWIEDYFTDFEEDLIFAVKAFIQDMRLAGGDQVSFILSA